MTLTGRKVLLGISGGIAAYKAPLVLRGLQERGADVRVVMTPSAHQFVAARPLEVLSRHPVHTDMWGSDPEFAVLHVGLAAWPDLVLVAPATAATISRMACGQADLLLAAVLLGTAAPVLVAAAMESHMLGHPATQANLEALRRRGCHLIEPAAGALASGGSGPGRLPEPAALVDLVERHLAGGDLAGMRLLVTAGPTLEDIDPVRFIGNRSSGKMGYALARRGQARGAEVCLVSGPTSLPVPGGVRHRAVRSAAQMEAAVQAEFAGCDVAIMAAAPADFRPRVAAARKLRRRREGLTLELVATPDIAAGLGAVRRPDQLLVIFALETGGGAAAAARRKRRRKGADLVVLNDLANPGAGFETDTNVVTLIAADGSERALPLLSKDEVADRILDWVVERRRAGSGTLP